MSEIHKLVYAYIRARFDLQSTRNFEFPDGCVVYVNCPQYTGHGIVTIDLSCPLNELPVLLENGNTWWYPIERCSRIWNVKTLPANVRREKIRYADRKRKRAKALRAAALREPSQSCSPASTPPPHRQDGTGQPSTQPHQRSPDGE